MRRVISLRRRQSVTLRDDASLQPRLQRPGHRALSTRDVVDAAVARDVPVTRRTRVSQRPRDADEVDVVEPDLTDAATASAHQQPIFCSPTWLVFYNI